MMENIQCVYHLKKRDVRCEILAANHRRVVANNDPSSPLFVLTGIHGTKFHLSVIHASMSSHIT